MLALSVYGISFDEIFFAPLPYTQAAPLGFLAFSKGLGIIFGYSEWVLYFLPLVAGLGILYLSFSIAQIIFPTQNLTLSQNLNPSLITQTTHDNTHFVWHDSTCAYLGQLIFATLVVGSLGLLHYSTEFKQYGIEAFTSFLLLYLYLKGISFKRFNLIALVCVLFSNTIIFIAFALSLGYLYANKQNLKSFIFRNLPYTILLGMGFVVYYLLYIRFQAVSGFYEYWQNYFLPHRLSMYPSFIKDTLLGIYSGFTPFDRGIVIPFYMLISLVGLYGLYNFRRDICVIALSAFAIYIALSLLHIYPFGHNGIIGGRLSLFMSPLFYLCCSFGAWYLMSLHNVLKKLGVGILALLLIVTCLRFGKNLITHSHYIQQTHSLISQLQSKIEPNDSIYVYQSSNPAMRYYLHLDDKILEYEIFDKDLDVFMQNLKQKILPKTSKHNVWILASHYPSKEWVSELIGRIKTIDNKAEVIEGNGGWGSVLIRLELG